MGSIQIKELENVPYSVNTITLDNDQAFSCNQHESSVLGSETFFTRPYTRLDKGT
jgi:hypothetical protein